MPGVMRPGQTRRPYGRNNGNNSYRNRQQIPNRSQTLDSNGPNVKIRGTPHQIFERYVTVDEVRRCRARGGLRSECHYLARDLVAHGEGQAYAARFERDLLPTAQIEVPV